MRAKKNSLFTERRRGKRLALSPHPVSLRGLVNSPDVSKRRWFWARQPPHVFYNLTHFSYTIYDDEDVFTIINI